MVEAVPVQGRNVFKAIRIDKDNDEWYCIRCGEPEQLKRQRDMLLLFNNSVSVPAVVEFVEEEGEGFLVTEWLEGISLETVIHTTYSRKNWLHLSRRRKRLLMRYLEQLLTIVSRMHQLGYRHRSLGPDMFIVKEEKLYLVDVGTVVRLTESTPEEAQTEVFILGMLMIHFLTNYIPFRFDFSRPERLAASLLYFVADEKIVRLIGNCVSSNVTEKPEIEDLLKEVDTYMMRIAVEPGKTVAFSSGKGIDLTQLVRDSLQLLVTANGPYTLMHTTDWHSGVAGLNYVYGRCPIPNISYRITDINSVSPVTAPGLYNGLAGIAVGLAAMGSNQLDVWFLPPKGFDIANGAAGQGLAALHTAATVGYETARQLAASYTSCLLEHQLQDGSWLVEGNAIDFSYGVAGIAGYLWLYYSYYNDAMVAAAAERAMEWLDIQPIPRWREARSGGEITGLSLAYITAYGASKNERYKEKAETLLYALPEFWHTSRFGFLEGYAGMGEVYLEAWRVLQNAEWKGRAYHIFNALMHVNKQHEKGYYWITDKGGEALPGLLTGNAGIVHFLMRLTTGAEVVPYLLFPHPAR